MTEVETELEAQLKACRPTLIFSRRHEIAKRAAKWCEDNKCPPTPHNIVTALTALGYEIKEGEPDE
jgi:hypothetical protein